MIDYKKFRQIAKEIGKTQSTISREINRHKQFYIHSDYSNNYYSCVYFKACKKCDHKCKFYKPIICKDRDKFYGACNNCEKVKNCKLDKYFYRATRAERDYRYNLSESRKGINLDENDLYNLSHLICPLIRQGQSIYVILENHPEIKLSAKTIYNYIDAGYFKDFGVTNMTLKRTIKRKKKRVSSTKLKKRKESVDYTGRTYADYLQYKLDNPDKSTTEMDTLYNHQSGPYIQTFIFYCQLRIGYPLFIFPISSLKRFSVFIIDKIEGILSILVISSTLFLVTFTSSPISFSAVLDNQFEFFII